MTHWIITGSLVVMLLSAAWMDVASRTIPNGICLAVCVLGAVNQLTIGPLQLFQSVAVASILFSLLFLLHLRQLIGGGDVKLLVALAIGLPPIGLVRLLAVMAVAGLILSLMHLAMRRLPRPRLAPAASCVLRRVYAVERWRILRHAPLPYGVAIACGGIFVLCNVGV